MANIRQKKYRLILNSKILTRKQRIDAFVKLGEYLRSAEMDHASILDIAVHKNAWYTKANIQQQIKAIAHNLTEEKLSKWLKDVPDTDQNKSVGLVLAGNLPLVGFHDIMCVLLAGFIAKIKVSSDDAGLTKFVLDKLIEIEPLFKEQIQLVDKLENFDLVIATGSNNSARYFEYYFGKKPHIIRKNRNSLSVLTGKESDEELQKLGHDIFDYFGLGCRSVSKIFIPEGYDIVHLLNNLESFHPIKDHAKYNNNYDFNKSIYLINKNKHFDNGFLLLKEDSSLGSPLAVVHFEYYKDLAEVEKYIIDHQDEIQCITSDVELHAGDVPVFPFGASQYPALDDYADNVNTLSFLLANQ